MKYVNIYDLIFNGGWDCQMVDNKEQLAPGPYVTLLTDSSAQCGRGLVTVWYRGKEIASQIMRAPRGEDDSMDVSGPSVGLLDDAAKWLTRHLQEILH